MSDDFVRADGKIPTERRFAGDFPSTRISARFGSLVILAAALTNAKDLLALAPRGTSISSRISQSPRCATTEYFPVGRSRYRLRRGSLARNLTVFASNRKLRPGGSDLISSAPLLRTR